MKVYKVNKYKSLKLVANKILQATCTDNHICCKSPYILTATSSKTPHYHEYSNAANKAIFPHCHTYGNAGNMAAHTTMDRPCATITPLMEDTCWRLGNCAILAVEGTSRSFTTYCISWHTNEPEEDLSLCWDGVDTTWATCFFIPQGHSKHFPIHR